MSTIQHVVSPHNTTSYDAFSVGAPIAGKLSDMVVVRMRAQRGGVWVPEDRLRVTLIGASIMAPLSVLAVGFILTYVDGTPGIVLFLVALFVNGLGVSTALSRW